MTKEVRKLQRVGGGTYTVSIPKEWAVEHGMEAGSDVHLYPHADGSLVVRGSPVDGDALSATRLDATGLSPPRTVRLLRAAYVTGFERIEVAADPLGDDQRRAVRRATRTLVGAEAVEEDGDRIVVRDLLDAAEVSVGQSLVGMRSVALSAHRTAAEAVTGDGVDLPRLRRRRDEVDGSLGVILRYCNRSLESRAALDRLGVSRTDLFDYSHVGRELAVVAGNAVRLGELAEWAGSDPAAPDDVAAAAETARTVVELATTAAVERCGDRVDEALDRREAVRARTADLEAALADRERPAAALRALDHIRRTAAAGERIAGTALRRSLEPGDD
ncbi:MAG: AbrB/MazE/SpoVT family DNA-binding domain-containing protein [Haloferacaceae archaeon]